MTETDYAQVTEAFKRKWNLIANSNKRMMEDVRGFLNQMAESDDKEQRVRLRDQIETYLDHVKDNRNTQVTLRGEYSFVCGRRFTKSWFPEGEYEVKFDPKIQDFRLE